MKRRLAPLFLWLCASTLPQVTAQVGFVNQEIPHGSRLIANPFGDQRVSEVLREVPEGTVLYYLSKERLLDSGLAQILEEHFLSHFPSELPGVTRMQGIESGWVIKGVGNLQRTAALDERFESISGGSELISSGNGGAVFWRTRLPLRLEPGQFSANVFAFGSWENPDQMMRLGEGFIIYNPGPSFVVTFVGSIPIGALVNAVPAGWSLKASMKPADQLISTFHNLQLPPGGHLILHSGTSVESYAALDAGRWHPSEPRIRPGEAFLLHSPEPVTWRQELSLEPPGP